MSHREFSRRDSFIQHALSFCGLAPPFFGGSCDPLGGNHKGKIMHPRFFFFLIVWFSLLLACRQSKQEGDQSQERTSSNVAAISDTLSLPPAFGFADKDSLRKLPLWMRGGRSGHVSQITFIDSGKYIVTRAEDISTFVQSVIRVHETSSGKLVHALRFNGSCSALSHNEKLLVTVTDNSNYTHDIHILDFHKGMELLSFRAPSAVYQIVFSHDDKAFATAGSKGLVCVWDANSGTLLRSYQGFKEDAWALLFSPDDSLIIARGGFRYECGIDIWNFQTGELKSSIPIRHLDSRAIALSLNGEFLAYSESTDSIALLEFRTNKMLGQFPTKERFPQTLSFSPDGKLLLLGSDGFHDMHTGDDYENTLLLWRTDDTSSQMELTGHSSDIKSSAFTPDGNFIVCGLDNGSVPLWDVKTGTLLRKDVNVTSAIRAAAFSSDGKSVITFDAQGGLHTWDTKRGNQLSANQLDGEIGGIAVIYSGKDFIAVSEPYTGVINFSSLSTGKSLRKISLVEKEIQSKEEENIDEETEELPDDIEIQYMALSKSGKFLLASTKEEIFLTETQTGRSLFRHKTEFEPRICLAFSPDEKRFAASLQSIRSISVWSTDQKETPLTLSFGEKDFPKDSMFSPYGYPQNLAFSKDGNYLAAIYDYGPALVWDIAQRKIAHIFNFEASSIAYSSDGTFLAISDTRGGISIWETKTFSLVAKCSTPFRATYDILQWSIDKGFLLGFTKDGAIAVWSVHNRAR